MPKKKERLRDIVVVLPGVCGSVLRHDEEDIWSISGRSLWKTIKQRSGFFSPLLLEQDDPDELESPDGVVATRMMPDVHIVPGLARVDGYSRLCNAFRSKFQIVDGTAGDGKPANFFEFPYDWRRDNRVTAKRLKRLIDEALPAWREFSGAQDARVILLAHSMGGLVSRYYLEVLGGWRNCKALITFGTPYRGSLNAVGFLANGYKKMFVDLTDVMRSFTSIYQLLPIYPCVKVNDQVLRVAEITGIPGVDQEKAQDALLFHREIENAVSDNESDPDYLKNGCKVVPFVGTRQPTDQSAIINDRDEVTLRRELPDGIDNLLADGDGTVPRLSAIPIELSDEYRDTFEPERHGSLQCNPRILQDTIGRITQMQVKGLSAIRGPETSIDRMSHPSIAVDMDEFYSTDEPLIVRAELLNAAGELGGVQALIEKTGEDGSVGPLEVPFEQRGGEWLLTTSGLEPGLYRIAVSTPLQGPDAPNTVHDVFEVGGD